MKSRSVLIFMILAFTFSSCSNIYITKRKFGKGYHVDVVRKNKRKNQSESFAAKKEPIKSWSIEENPEVFDSSEKRNSDEPPQMITDVGMVKPDLKLNLNTKPNSYYMAEKSKEIEYGLRKLLIKKEESTRWSVLSIVAFGLGVLAVLFILTGLALLISWYSSEYSTNANKPALAFVRMASILAFVSLFTGIGGSKSAKRKKWKGRGFGITGFVLGLVSLFILLLTLLIIAIGGI